MAQKVTIKDVAELAGVSKSTVSRYLNHGYISSEKQERVRRAIEETGFTSNFFAKRLKTKESKLIGIVLPRMDSVSVGRLLTGISRMLEPAGYQELLVVSHLDPAREIAAIHDLLQQGVDGIIVDSVEITPDHKDLAASAAVPILFTGQSSDRVPFVKIDDYGAGRMMGAYLRQMGHSRALFVGVTERDIAVGCERREGFTAAFTEGREGAEVGFIESGFDFMEAYSLAPAVRARAEECGATVIVGATDNISLGILRYLHEQRVDVPGELSVTGFGGYDVGAVVYPALTTIAFDYELVGMKTGGYLLDLLKHRERAENLSIPLFLLSRESVARLA